MLTRLRDCRLTIHQQSHGVSIGPTHSKTEANLADKSVYLVSGSLPVFTCQPDEFNIPSGVSLPHFLVFRNLSTTGTTLRSPNIYYHDFALKV